MNKLIIFLFIIKTGLCWKPISGPTSFSITQQHPSIGGGLSSAALTSTSALQQHNTNSILESNNLNNGDQTITTTYHGNGFLNEYAHHDEFLNGDDSTVGNNGPTAFDSGDFEGRILSHKNSFYGSKLLEGFLPETINDGHCSTNKYALDSEGTIQYDHAIPKLDQFTLCSWVRFTNHSGDHSIFTYSVNGEPREIQFWVANAKGSSYISLAIHGQSLYRLNYPLKMQQWHHACTSWNGKTGEWQLWVKAERVGRGFHNRLVGHIIKPHGVVFSGGPSITGPVANGLHMEITMLQLYKIGLSAGKAHRDHKHHHVHMFNHDGLAPATQPPPTPMPIQPLQSTNPLLANGQISTRLRINLAGVQPQPGQPIPSPGIPVQGLPSQLAGTAFPQQQQQQAPQQQPSPGLPLQFQFTQQPAQQQQQQQQQQPQQQATIGTQFANGQFSSAERFLSQQLVGNQIQSSQLQKLQPTRQQQSLFRFPQNSSPTSFGNIGDPINSQFLDGSNSDESHFLFKRDEKTANKVDPKEVVEKDKKIAKRALVTLTDGSVIDDKIIAQNVLDFDGLAQYGAPAFQQHLSKMMDIEDEIRHHDREPAEGEVQAVLQTCSSCDVEPFIGAIVMSWQNVKIQTENALKARSQGGCGDF